MPLSRQQRRAALSRTFAIFPHFASRHRPHAYILFRAAIIYFRDVKNAMSRIYLHDRMPASTIRSAVMNDDTARIP